MIIHWLSKEHIQIQAMKCHEQLGFQTSSGKWGNQKKVANVTNHQAKIRTSQPESYWIQKKQMWQVTASVVMMPFLGSPILYPSPPKSKQHRLSQGLEHVLIVQQLLGKCHLQQGHREWYGLKLGNYHIIITELFILNIDIPICGEVLNFDAFQFLSHSHFLVMFKIPQDIY